MPSAPLAAALAEHDGDDRHLEGEEFAQVDRDGLGDVPLLRRDAGIGAGRVDESDDGQVELLRQPHQAQRLAVALGVGEPEVVLDVLLGVVALLVAHDHHLLVADGGEAADERLVVAEAAVAAHLHEIGGDELDVVEGVGPRRMTHDLHALPGAEVGVDLAARLRQLGLQRLHLGHGIGGVLLRALLQEGNRLLQFDDRLLEFQRGQLHFRRKQEGSVRFPGRKIKRHLARADGLERCALVRGH